MKIIDGVLVLYNPDEHVWDNIQSYVRSLRTLFVVDNSENSNTHLITRLQSVDNVVYINLYGNKGIAVALNVGASRAIAQNADWLLMMDQDSRFDDGAFSKMARYVNDYKLQKTVGILSAAHQVDGLVLFKDQLDSQLVEVQSVMTSGNLLNLQIYKKIGGFLESYFIDCVDHEYCLRLRKNGYKVKICKSAKLEHALGDIGVFSFFGKAFYFTNHSATRRYYMTRNRLDMSVRYFFVAPKFVIKELLKIVTEWMKIILFERQKIRKSVAILKGFLHFLISRSGKM